MARSDPQLNFRCPSELKEQIEKAAGESGRSITAEIVNRLMISFTMHRYADVLRVLVQLHEDLLADRAELDIPPHLQDEIHQLAEARGVSPQKLLIRLVINALQELDEQTEVGQRLDALLREDLADD